MPCIAGGKPSRRSWKKGPYVLIDKENKGELFRLLQLNVNGPLRPSIRVREQGE
jgi:hypothetical protein